MSAEASILVVDDHAENLGLLFRALEQAGYTVRVADSGPLALASARRKAPDLILLDVMMPVLDGFDTCRRLKQDAATSEVPVIFLTARTDTHDEVQGLRLGAVDFITKPVQIEAALARIETHLALRRLQRTLEGQNRDLDAYARSVAHDLKNPLTAILAATQMILLQPEEADRETTRNYARMIYSAGEAATTTINELLALAGVRQGEVRVRPLVMGAIVDRAVRRLSLLFEEYQGQLELPESWPLAYGHGPWVELVWTNYLSNGLKYGGRPPLLSVGATSQADGMVRFWVRDNGPGVPAAMQAQLFVEGRRFAEQRAEGHGLGLALVRRIVERLGGEVGLAEGEAPGSTFYFTLPALPPLAEDSTAAGAL